MVSKLHSLALTPTSVVLEIENEYPYFINEEKEEFDIFVNNKWYKKTNAKIFSVYQLHPNQFYEVSVKGTSLSESIKITTMPCNYLLDVRKFGAKGNGIDDDTFPLQAAIMACPKNGLVVIPEGIYLVSPLFLRDDIMIELQKGAMIKGKVERTSYPILPGVTRNLDELEEHEYILGSWEGNPLDNFSSLITGINVHNVLIYGEGVINGSANESDWWIDHKAKRIAYRPHIIFLNHCENIKVMGVNIKNSASWTIHPFYSSNLSFYDLKIENPYESPNTDGLNPESCQNVEIMGVYFNVGDDCIAIKSGKIYMANYHLQPCDNILIRNCFMQGGHGGVVLGSEMSCGMNNIQIEQCFFYTTDRGIRIKTRRGRGKTARINNLQVRDIIMSRVLTPFVINMFYYCDPDGKSEYVWSKEALPVTDKTPSLGTFTFQNIKCSEVSITAGFFYGLKEAPIEKVTLENVSFDYLDNPSPGYPAMMSHLEKRIKEGLYFQNVQEVILKNVTIEGQIGEAVVTNNVQIFVQK